MHVISKIGIVSYLFAFSILIILIIFKESIPDIVTYLLVGGLIAMMLGAIVKSFIYHKSVKNNKNDTIE